LFIASATNERIIMKTFKQLLIASSLCAALPLSAQQEQSAQPNQTQPQPGSEKSQQELKVSDQELKHQVTDANKASKLIGMHVKNKEDQDVGKIKDVVIDFQSGKVAYAVLAAGGTLGLGGKLVALPVQALTLEPGQKALVVDLPKQQISQAQGFNDQNWPDLDAAEKGQTIGLAASEQQKSQGGTGSESEQASRSQSSGTITNLQQLSAGSDPASFRGKRVDLKDAKVQQVLGKDAVTLTSEGAGQAVLVKSQRGIESLKAGQTVTVSGSVRPMPQNPSQLGLDQTALQKIQGQKFYIQAHEIKPSEQ